MSPFSIASAYCRTRSLVRASPSVRRADCWLLAGPRAAIVTRARCRALVTDAADVPSWPAISAAEKPATSRSSSTARCSGGRCCTAATNASSMLSRCS